MCSVSVRKSGFFRDGTSGKMKKPLGHGAVSELPFSIVHKIVKLT